MCACLQVAARRASWFWIGRVTSCTQPTWETLGSWWSEEGRWSIAQTSSSTTLTHPSSCPLHPQGLKGPSSVTGKMPNRLYLCAHIWIGELGQAACLDPTVNREEAHTHWDNRSHSDTTKWCVPQRQQCFVTVLCWAMLATCCCVSLLWRAKQQRTRSQSARQSLGVCQAFPLTRVKVYVGCGANRRSHSQSCSSRLSHLFTQSSRR